MNSDPDEMALAHAALQGMRQPLLVLDGQSRPRLRNPAAVELLARGDVLAHRAGRIACADVESGRRLTDALEEVLQGGASCRRVRLARTPAVGEVAASIRSLHANGSGEPLAVLSLFQAEACPETHARILASTFGLTPAEARIAAQVANGLPMKEIARGLDIAMSTARSHLQGLFEKTGARRQVDLVRLLLLASAL